MTKKKLAELQSAILADARFDFDTDWDKAWDAILAYEAAVRKDEKNKVWDFIFSQTNFAMGDLDTPMGIRFSITRRIDKRENLVFTIIIPKEIKASLPKKWTAPVLLQKEDS